MNRQSTPRQRAAVLFCLDWLYNVEFTGNINSFHDCSTFLSIYLDYAKSASEEAYIEESTWRWEKDY